MTETHLRTRIHSLAYGLTLLAFTLLAYLNLRYGFYSLFYGALFLILLAGTGLGYTLWVRKRQLLAGGHSLILALMGLVILGLTLKQGELVVFWLFPLILLALLLLPLNRGLLLAALTILLPGLVLLRLDSWVPEASLLSALLLAAMAALFAYRYHHNARSLVELTTTDPTTGAFNARFFDETLHREISRAKVTGHPLSLVKLSVDYYPDLARLHGEPNLQPFLAELSETLGQTIRAGDSHYYLGRGEFLLLLPFTPEEGVRVIVERIRRVISERQWRLVESATACLGGVSWYPGDETSANELVESARQALEEARKRGHNRTWHLASAPDTP